MKLEDVAIENGSEKSPWSLKHTTKLLVSMVPHV